MLRDFEFGARGLEALAEFYESNRGTNGEELITRFGYAIRTNYKLRDGAITNFVSREVELAHVQRPFRTFLAYHELGHIVLANEDSVFETIASNGGDPLTEVGGTIEYWCDNFAILMMFAAVGIHIAPSSELKPFLEAALPTGGDLWREQHIEFCSALSIHSGKLILRHAKYWFSRGGSSRPGLVYTALTLISNAQWQRKQWREWKRKSSRR